jgi:hypothetical protein
LLRGGRQNGGFSAADLVMNALGMARGRSKSGPVWVSHDAAALCPFGKAA